MTENERVLIAMLKYVSDANIKAVVLQSYIAEKGPLSEEAGVEVRKLLKNST